MKSRNLIILVVAAIVLVGLAYMSASRKANIVEPSGLVGQHVLPALRNPDALNNIEKVVFESAGATVIVAKTDGVWVAPDRHDYPIDFGRVRDFLRTLSELKVGQALPSGMAQLEELALVPSSGEPARTGIVVRCQDKNGKETASLIIGKEHVKSRSAGDWRGGYPDGRYVAVGQQAFLVTETFSDIPDNSKNWLDDDLVNVSSADITGITVTDTNGTSLMLKRPSEGGDLALSDLKDKEEMDASKVSGLAGVLSYLTLSDVANPSLSDKDTGLDTPVIYVAKGKDGKAYTLRLGGKYKDSDDCYVRLSVAFEPPETLGTVASVKDEAGKEDVLNKTEQTNNAAGKASEEDAKKKKEEQEKSAREVRELDKKLSKWTYLVSSHKVDGITANRADLIKTKEEDVKEEAGVENEEAEKKEADAEKHDNGEGAREEKTNEVDKIDAKIEEEG